MAKKKAKPVAKKATKKAPKAAAKKPAKKAPAKKASKKKAPAKKAEKAPETLTWEQIDLDPPVKAAFDLLNTSAEVSDELEGAAQDALAGAVKTVFGKHAIELTEDQAMVVTLALFSDGDGDEDEDE